MKIAITLTQDDSSRMELVKMLNKLGNEDVIRSIEDTFTDIKTDLVPFLSDVLISEHQLNVVGEKIKKKNGSNQVLAG